jgi:hypothetical protein
MRNRPGYDCNGHYTGIDPFAPRDDAPPADTLDARIAAVYGQDFVDFVNAINAPYTPRAV